MSGEGRVRLLSISVLAIGIIFATRLVYLQAFVGDRYLTEAQDQYANSESASPYDRGSIYFTQKSGERVTAAGIQQGYVLAINPSMIVDADSTYKSLSTIILLDKDVFDAKVSKSSDPYEELAHHVDDEVGKRIEELALPGVIVSREQWRYYPGGPLASQVLGFVGYKDNNYSGQYGIERYFDSSLTRDTDSLYSNFFSEIFTGIKEQVFGNDEDRASDITLTIEPRVQDYISEQLSVLIEKWSAKGAGAVVIDPKTGEIIAMSALPDFDPNFYGQEDSAHVYSNPFVEDVFEMGSIMKPITMSAGLDAQVVRADSTYTDKGFVELDSKRINNYDGVARGKVSMQEVLNQSLNTGSVFVMQQLGTSKYGEYLHKFGFYDKTGIDLPNESVNLVGNLSDGKDVEFATASFGQGIALTPISMIRALSAIANGGYLIKPHVVKSIDYDLGLSEETKVAEQGRAISAMSSEEVTRMLVKVVDEVLADGKVKMPHFSIAAKTGTAQIANPAGGGYYDDRYLHSFFGYFPAYNPRFLVFIYLDQPREVRYASETLALPFHDIAKYLINYYEIPPDR